jgi:hypothetical protein
VPVLVRYSAGRSIQKNPTMVRSMVCCRAMQWDGSWWRTRECMLSMMVVLTG